MSLLKRLFSPRAVGKDSVHEHWGNPSEWTTLLGGQNARWVEFDEAFGRYTPAISEAAYARHPIVSRCVDLIGDIAPEPRLEIGREINGAWEAVSAHPLLDLFQNPAPWLSYNGLLRWLLSNRALTGYGYAMKVRNRAGSKAVQVWTLPTSWVSPIASQGETDQPWAGFRVRGISSPVAPEDMIVCRQFSPASPFHAVGCFESAFRAYVLDSEREQYQAEMIGNLKVPGVAVVTEHPLGDDAKADARREFAERFGKGRRGGIAFISGGGNIEVLNPLKDIDWPGLTNLSETRICTAFGISPMIIHARAGLEKAHYNNYQTAHRAFYVTTMKPLWDATADDLTISFRRELGPGLEFRFRYDEHPMFQDDEDKKSARIVREYQAGIIPRTIALQELGYDPDEIEKAEDEERRRAAEREPEEDAPPEGQDETEDDKDAQE